MDALVTEGGDVILDEVVMRVDAKHKARVFDPRRTWAGLLTAALTWGVFGLVTGGWASGGIWAVLGAVAGGVFAYTKEHLLTKNQLTRLGRSVPPDSSALAVYLQAADPQQVLSRTASLQPTTASVAVIAADLSTQVHTIPAGAVDTQPGSDHLAMVLARYHGQQGAHDALQRGNGSGTHAKGKAKPGHEPQVELLIQTDANGRHRVVDPTTGAQTTARGDVVSWGLFGLVCGAIAGYLGSSGILGAVERGLLTALGWGVFGLVAGALYGLWAGRGVSARQIKRIGPILPPDTSTVIAWADDAVPKEAITAWAAGSSDMVTLWFTPTAEGARLETQREELHGD